MKKLLLLCNFAATCALADGLPVVNGNPINSFPGQVRVSRGNTEVWDSPSTLTNLILDQSTTSDGVLFRLSAITTNNPGTNYTHGQTLTLSGGTQNSRFPSAATFTIGCTANGVITNCTLVSVGNYSVAPSSPATATYTVGGGSNATFTVTFTNRFAFMVNGQVSTATTLVTNANVTNLNVYFTQVPINHPITVHMPLGIAANMMFKHAGTNFATFFAGPPDVFPGAIGFGNPDTTHYVLMDPETGAFSWSGVATGNGGGLTRIQEQALVYPAANPAAGLVLTSTSSNTAAWLAPSGQSLGIVTNGGTGIDNTLSNLTVISSVGTRNALLIKTPPGGNTVPIFAITNVGVASTHFLHVDNNGVLYANGAGVTNLGGIKIWRGTLTQSGTGAPTATVHQNTLGGTITWARSSAGVYTGTLTGAFTASKTLLLNGNTYADANNVPTVAFSRTSANVVTVSTLLLFEGSNAFADDVLVETSFQILVQP